MSTGNGKPLRFAALIRVSTEQQEKKGESLRTQRKQIEQAVASLGGAVAGTYAGQEHATAGHERQQLDKLLADAQKPHRPFDAVIVADPSRWSRDNVKSETGLDTLREYGVRFYVLTTEYDLFDPQSRLFLGLSSTIGAFQARVQKQKSLLNRIERARRGLPTGGKLPFGRVWDADKQEWAIDPAKQAMIADVAERYLAGEPLPKLAKEYRVNHANSCKVLRERCGGAWEIDFDAPDLNIRETATLAVPPLLDEKTIKDIRRRLKANRTYLHKPPRPVYDWLLSGHIFCAECGYSLFGQLNPGGRRYYRHGKRDGAFECPVRPRPWVPADRIEGEVVHDLFNLFGSPAAIAAAVKAAVPDCDNALKRRARLEADIKKVEKSRGRVIDAIADGLLTKAQAKPKLDELKEQEDGLRQELDELTAALADVPDPEEVRRYIEKVGASVFVYDDEGKMREGGNSISTFLAMTRADKRRLIEAVFDAPLADSTPAGVYVSPGGGGPHRPKKWAFTIRGRLEFELVMQNAKH
jgi:DNA invertase Pin-like site-specific DNA recombinase